MTLHFTEQEFEIREKKVIQSMKEKNRVVLFHFGLYSLTTQLCFHF